MNGEGDMYNSAVSSWPTSNIGTHLSKLAPVDHSGLQSSEQDVANGCSALSQLKNSKDLEVAGEETPTTSLLMKRLLCWLVRCGVYG